MSVKTEATSIANRIGKLKLLEKYILDHQQKAKRIVAMTGVFISYIFQKTETGGRTNRKIGAILSRVDSDRVYIGWSLCHPNRDTFYACVAISKAFERCRQIEGDKSLLVPVHFCQTEIENINLSQWRSWCKDKGIHKRIRSRLLRMVIRATRYAAKLKEPMPPDATKILEAKSNTELTAART